MESNKRFYFAHPVNVYNTPLEQEMVKFIKKFFPNIENPNQPQHQIGYKTWAAQTAQNRDKHKGMNYFFDEVLPQCEGCIAMPFLDGRFGLGVAGEAKWFLEHKMPLWIVGPTLIPENSDFLKFVIGLEGFSEGVFVIRKATRKECGKILKDDPLLVVPHQETRLRTWIVYNKTRRPYETAHLVSMPIPKGFYSEQTS